MSPLHSPCCMKVEGCLQECQQQQGQHDFQRDLEEDEMEADVAGGWMVEQEPWEGDNKSRKQGLASRDPPGHGNKPCGKDEKDGS